MALTAKQQRFVEEYLVDLNATQAAIRAGYSERTAGSVGNENLKKPEIQKAITGRMNRLADESDLTVKRIWEGLLKEAEYYEDGSSHSARVSAWAHLAKYKGMFIDKQEIEGGLEIRVNRVAKDD